MNKPLPHGWTIVSPLSEDGSSRRYSRVRKNHVDAVLMECYGDTPGHRMEDFIRISQWLNSIGLKAPEIYEQGSDFLILEDFGDISFKIALQNERPEKMYGLAVEVLEHLKKQRCPLSLPNYFDSHVHMGHRRVVDWFIPAVRMRPNPDGLVESYLHAWAQVEQTLHPQKQSFQHIDFHVENLMFLPHEAGLKQCGILDFQGGMMGHPAYDLGNLLEDPRIDVPFGLRASFLQKYDADFLNWYRVLTSQFHCRILGQFIKLSLNGKPQYLEHIPRAAGYLQKALKDPLLKPVQVWFKEQDISFNEMPCADNIRDVIREDAF